MQVEQLETRRLLALNPTADEQEYMQLVNRFRTDPKGEFSRLIAVESPIKARDPVIQSDTLFTKVNGSLLKSELNALSPTHPVAWNEAIRDYTANHNQAIIARGTHFHSNTAQRRAALLAAGVDLRIVAGEKINSENVFGYAKSVNHLFASYVIDWGTGGSGGMQAGRTHRAAIHNPDYEQAGHAITNHTGSGSLPLGPKVNSQVLANIENPPVFVTGAIFQDKNSSRWYEAGEGLSSVRFTFEDQQGKKFQTTGFGSGGYQIELPAGTYTATATGGGMKYTQRMSNITVGSVNVWKNWIYDPNVIPPDALESNNSTASATPLSGEDQSFSGLSINTASDVDLFRLKAVGSGMGTFQIQFANASGNIDLQLLNASGSVIASSATTGNTESITTALNRDSTYFVKVFGRSGATNDTYSLSVSPPAAVPPIANGDRATFTATSGSMSIDVLSNDLNPDGSHASLTPNLAAGTHSAFKVNGKRVEYSRPANFSGVHRAQYSLTNDQQVQSGNATIAVMVLDFTDNTPWQNNQNSQDVNDDGSITALDALLAINALNNVVNNGLPAELPGGAAGADKFFGFIDASGDGFITPLDALLVVNRLNGDGEGEANAANLASEQRSTDLAFGNFDFADAFPFEFDDDRRKESRLGEPNVDRSRAYLSDGIGAA